jgi:hypothetical protein
VNNDLSVIGKVLGNSSKSRIILRFSIKAFHTQFEFLKEFFVLIALKATLPTSNARSEASRLECKNCKKQWPFEALKKICLDNNKI